MTTDNEQRRNVRVPFKASVSLWPIKQDVRQIQCEMTRDISMKGVFCYSDIKLPAGTACEMELELVGSSSKLILFIKGRIIRLDDDGMGIKFEEMDLDSFLHLKNILQYNTGVPEKIDQELTARN